MQAMPVSAVHVRDAAGGYAIALQVATGTLAVAFHSFAGMLDVAGLALVYFVEVVAAQDYKSFNGICTTGCNGGSRNFFYTDVVTLNNPGDCHNFEGILVNALIAVDTNGVDNPAYLPTATARICDES
jgi:hypothetical protein